MLNNFITWARQVAIDLLGKNIEAWVTESEISDNSSARLDIDTPNAVARITCWASGDYEMEVINLKTEKVLFSSHGSLRVEQKFSEQFAKFFNSLGVVAG